LGEKRERKKPRNTILHKEKKKGRKKLVKPEKAVCRTKGKYVELNPLREPKLGWKSHRINFLSSSGKGGQQTGRREGEGGE